MSESRVRLIIGVVVIFQVALLLIPQAILVIVINETKKVTCIRGIWYKINLEYKEYRLKS